MHRKSPGAAHPRPLPSPARPSLLLLPPLPPLAAQHLAAKASAARVTVSLASRPSVIQAGMLLAPKMQPRMQPRRAPAEEQEGDKQKGTRKGRPLKREEENG